MIKSCKNYFMFLFFVFGVTMAFNTINFKTIEDTVKQHVSLKQVTCLAKNIYYEAGHESTEGKAAVARVVVNRVNHGFASTPCQVIYQAKYVEQNDERVKVCQFSWVCEGKSEPNKNDPRYVQSLNIAYNVLENNSYNDVLPKSALYFHNLTVKIDNSWPYHKIKQIGNHIFYGRQYGKSKEKSKQ